MSGDVQPRKRKDKRRKKEDLPGSEDVASSNISSDENLHIHKDSGTGGNICAKIVFFMLLGALAVMIGLILIEYRGSSDVDTPIVESKWAQVFDGWVDDSPPKHDEHDEPVEESGEHEEQEHSEEEHEEDEHEEEEHDDHEEKEEAVSEEAQSPEEEEEEEASEEEQAPEEEEEEEESGPEESEEDQEKEEEEEEEEEEDEGAEASEEQEGIPGVTESAEDEDEGDDDEQAEDDKDASEEAAEESGEARRISTIVPVIKSTSTQISVTETQPIMSSEAHTLHIVKSLTKESQRIQESKDRHIGEPSESLRKTHIHDAQDSFPNTLLQSEAFKQKDSKDMLSSSEFSRTFESDAGLQSSDFIKVSEPDFSTKLTPKPTLTLESSKILDNVSSISISYTTNASKLSSEKQSTVHILSGEKSFSGTSSGLTTAYYTKTLSENPSIFQTLSKHQSTSEGLHNPNSTPVISEEPIIAVSHSLSPSSTSSSFQEPLSIKSVPHKTVTQPSHVHDFSKQEDIRDKKSKYSLPEEETEIVASEISTPKLIQESEKYSSESSMLESKYSQSSTVDRNIVTTLSEKISSSEHIVLKDVKGQKTHIKEQEKEVTEPKVTKTLTLDSPVPEGSKDTAAHLKQVSELPVHTSEMSQETSASNINATQHVKEEEEGDDDDDDDNDDGDEEEEAGEVSEEVEGEDAEEEREKEDAIHKDEDENDKEDEEPSGATKSAVTPEESGTEEEEESEEEEVVPIRKGTKSSGEQAYANADVSNDDDLNIRERLDVADADLDEKPDAALQMFVDILTTYPDSPRARHGKAQALDRLAEKKHNNALLQEAIDTYESVLSLGTLVPDKLFLQAAERCINRMRFKGQHHTAIHIHKKLIQRFSEDPAYPNQLAVTYLMINRLADAKRVLEDTLRRWPKNGFAQVHYGFILKTGDNNNEEAVNYLTRGIATREPGTIDGRFFFQLGDALTRLDRHEEAGKIYELGVREGLFLSKYQRSLYNVNRLLAQPWWTPEQTTYSKYFKKLQDYWKEIRAEGLSVLADKVFKDEAENLRDVGNWQQFELFARGRKITANCRKAPFTCDLISEFPAARDCRRGQVKFSVMLPGTHVWPHCGPTNCRLRSHLGLVVPHGTYIRVADEIRTWEEGKLFIFDDSFEHEVWHNGTSTRLVLIVDVWHPELTEEEKRSMPAI